MSRWYKLRSKPGKKEKERGEIEVDIQFMRSNMTASMFDLSSKDRPRSAFGKLKNKLKGKRSSGLSDTASAIIPSTTHSPADSEDEAVEKEKKKSKFKSLFSKASLQKNSLSQSLSVLPTQNPSTQRVRLRPSDFQSEWDDEELEASPASERAFGSPLEEKSSPSPVFKARKTATLDSRQLNPVTTSHTKREGLSLFSGLKSKSDPASKSSLCINGTHVYMEESTVKDNTPASSPSPLNFRRKQLFASEENLTSRSPKGAEDPGRTSPIPAPSGSSSLETFKSMTLPSYRLLSTEEYQETNSPLSLEVVKETKKPEPKKPPLLSLVTGKKEAARSNDAENIPSRTPQDEESKIPEEKSEHKHLAPPADVSRGNPPEERQHAGGVLSSKQPPNPFEEEQKPEKTAALPKTKAVKPRLGLTSEEEPKATLPTLAPQSLPAFLSVHQISSDKNPFLSKKEQKAQVPQSENITAPSPPLAWRGKNPFTPPWDRAPPAPHPDTAAHSPSPPHLAASAPKKGQIPANNPFASAWGQSSAPRASCSPPPSPLPPSDSHFKDNNPFGSKLGWESEGTTSKAVTSSCCLPPDGEQEHSGSLGNSSDAALPGEFPPFLGILPDIPALAPEQQRDSPQLEAETSMKKRKGGQGTPVSHLLHGSEDPRAGGEGFDGQECQIPPGGSAKPTLGPCKLPPGETEAGRAGGEVAPRPAPRTKHPVVHQAGALSAALPSSGKSSQSPPGLAPPSEKTSDPGGFPPQGGSGDTVTPAVTLRGSRSLRNEGEDELFDSLRQLKPSSPGTADPGLKLAGLPAIPEGSSDDELLGDTQEDCGVPAGDKATPETGRQSRGPIPLPGELEELSECSPAAQRTPAAPGGEGGGAAGAAQPVPPARGDIHSVTSQAGDKATPEAGKQSRGLIPLPGELEELSGSSPAAPGGEGGGAAGAAQPLPPARGDIHSVTSQAGDPGLGGTSHSGENHHDLEKHKARRSAGAEECLGPDFSELSFPSPSLPSPSQPCSASPSSPSDPQNHGAESPEKPAAEGSADKAGNSGKKKLLQAWVSPSETFPKPPQQSGETLAPKHRLHPVKPMNTTAPKSQSKNLNVISTMSEKLLEMNVQNYHPSDPAYAYAQLTHSELIQLVLKQKDTISKRDLQVRELEDYIDNLLVRVMEETPNILRVSMAGNKKAGKM
ncbi:rab11 family-interacting protein 1 isoform X2 [Calypte anna]|uniref:rab11 family-interacting protein 1 isoform X2 n=1 Tax=Calypte anna TaxID=9244 RepID=UPI0011C42FB8|nr:rab11 family-interacting protein 1 isoform X2 [Calypte anna]